mgnify:FL=1
MKVYCCHCQQCDACWITSDIKCRSCDGQLTREVTPIEYQGADGFIVLSPAESEPASDFAFTLQSQEEE